MAFHKKKGLKVEEMAKSDWVYRKLRNFRAGLEAGISYLKRCFGLRRCNWKGLEHFKAYVWSAVVTHKYGDVGAFEACLNPAGTDHFLKWGVSSGWQSPK